MDTDVMLSQCPACKFKQPFDFLKYNREGECITCDKCHIHYKINSGVLYGREMTEQEYKEWKFIQKLTSDDKE